MSSTLITAAIADLLNQKAEQYNHPNFITADPVSVPHRYSKSQDIEIMGFWVAMLAWGKRSIILQKAAQLEQLIDYNPHEFVLHFTQKDLERFDSFKHRTFNLTDTVYFLQFLQHYYREHNSLETAFLKGADMQQRLASFHTTFFNLPEAPQRTRKHVSTPTRKSACKRLNMFLRWMVRKEGGVDFGLWQQLQPHELICPLDVHVERVSRSLGLLTRKQTDWQAASELTDQLRKLDPADPVKYDFALFGLGLEKWQ